jgi:hypothetical protein
VAIFSFEIVEPVPNFRIKIWGLKGFLFVQIYMKRHFMICIENRGYKASLETRKIYEVLSDKEAERHRQIRVIDESGEDYLYPAYYFAPIRLPSATKEKIELITA